MKWESLQTINGWRSAKDNPIKARRLPTGEVEIMGGVEGGEEGKPQVRFPPHLMPEIPEGQPALVITRFSTGFTYNGVDHPPTYGPRDTIWRNGDWLRETEIDVGLEP